MTEPINIVLQANNQPSQPGWMLSEDSGYQKIMRMPPELVGSVMFADLNGRAPHGLHDMSYALHGMLVRPDLQEYLEDVRSCLQSFAGAFGRKPIGYGGGVHEEGFWIFQRRLGNVEGIIKRCVSAYLRDDNYGPQTPEDDGSPEANDWLIDELPCDGYGAAGSEIRRHVCGVQWAMKMPIRPEGRANHGTWFQDTCPEMITNYSTDLAEIWSPSLLSREQCGSDRHGIIVIGGRIAPTDAMRWRMRGYRVFRSVGIFDDQGDVLPQYRMGYGAIEDVAATVSRPDAPGV